MLTVYKMLSTSLSIITVLYIAETLHRIAQAIYEYLFYWKHYEAKNRSWTIVTRAFAFNPRAQLLFVALLLALPVSTSEIMKNFLSLYWYFIPTWWLLAYVKISDNSLKYAHWIRSDHGLDYATGMASNYFHGYLNLTMPTHDEQKGIRERIRDYESKNKAWFPIKRLIILISSSLHCRPIIESEIMERVKPLERVLKNRAGVSRPFKNDVYRFSKPIDGKFIYATIEGATPLLSFFEAMNFPLTSTWQMSAMKKEILLKFYTHLKGLIKKWPDTNKECELLLYDDQNQDVGRVLLSHMKNIGIQIPDSVFVDACHM